MENCKQEYKFTPIHEWEYPYYTINQYNQLVLRFSKQEERVLTDDLIYVCYTKEDVYDTLHKHSTKEIVENAFNKYCDINEKLKWLGCEVKMFSIPKKYFNEMNACIHMSATKRLSNLEYYLTELDNIIDIEIEE